jgi:hypothetical protein
VGGGVGDDDAVDELGAGGEDGGVVGGVDRLGEIAPAGKGGNSVLAQILDGGQHIGPRGQQTAVAEGGEDPGVLGGGRTQIEEAALGGGGMRVELVAEVVGTAIELGGGEQPVIFAGLLSLGSGTEGFAPEPFRPTAAPRPRVRTGGPTRG